MLSAKEMEDYAGPDPLLSVLTPNQVFGGTPDLLRFRVSVEQVSKAYREEGWHHLGDGRHRTVFGDPGRSLVAKVSRTLAGAQANLYEWLSAKENTGYVHRYSAGLDIPVPKVLWFQQGLNNVSVLFVERVNKASAHTVNQIDKSWVEYADGYQIGCTATGRVVCYDWCPF